jgi:hypothetical protein
VREEGEGVHARLGEETALTVRAEAAERQRDRLIADVEHLRAQLDVRAEELRRHQHAEEQLMAALSQQNRVLTDMLETKMLPPAPEPPRKVRWWHLWRRG